ncbi:MAG: hypothetical protein ACLUGQ_08650 [Coprococcus sp.]
MQNEWMRLVRNQGSFIALMAGTRIPMGLPYTTPGRFEDISYHFKSYSERKFISG